MKTIKAVLLSLSCMGIARADIPGCDYFDTVDLSTSTKFPNGSYLFEHMLIPSELTAEYDYEILSDGDTSSVPNHVRGCACRLRSCVRFCCHRNLRLVDGERKCSGDIKAATDFDPFINVTQADGQMVRKHVLDEFVVQESLPVPCSAHFYLDNLNNKDNDWTLFENGSLLRHIDNRMLSKQDYCLQPHTIETPSEEMQVMLVPHNCMQQPKGLWGKTILCCFTLIGLVLTSVVYLSLPKLRNLHGYCLTCYLFCLLVAYSAVLLDMWKMMENNCKLNGYVGYFAVMSGFLWLTVVSFDLWNSFCDRSFNVHTLGFKFRIYSIYAWGIASLFTIIVVIMDNVLDKNNEQHLQYLPGSGLYSCWIKTEDWSAMIYFYGPMSLQIIFNVTMFILTAVRIVGVRKEIRSFALRQERQQKLNSDKQTYGLFVRLFVVMGVTWTFEIFSYLSQNYGVLSKIFNFFDYINFSQGIIIFVMFVLKRSVLKLISDRIRQRKINKQDPWSKTVYTSASSRYSSRKDIKSLRVVNNKYLSNANETHSDCSANSEL
ncbi:G-protein coupled receptor Mth-like [Drosophila busckii]|uniref:G-protein coupled receptor Mth-like n=1 Tax=Drosophila busckii TaxID=30019 RepID=UPI00083F1843|nr:G-protein coupled receptor Mth-like [Drosophila busckii]